MREFANDAGGYLVVDGYMHLEGAGRWGLLREIHYPGLLNYL